MKLFIKNSYLFLILFLLIISKNFLYKTIYANSIEINSIKTMGDNKIYSAKKLYQNPYQYNKELYIIVNSNIKENDYVINDKGLIGIIKKNNKNYAVVNLLTSNNVSMQVKINDCYGILENGVIKNVSNYCKVNVGDKIYSSDLSYIDNQYLIGTIKEIKIDKNNIDNYYYIKYINNSFDNLQVIDRDSL